MKISRIRFQNLNSLIGTWSIDLTDPAYLGNSLFAITGPTGAGKTTLLDAICLALYGRTPRLGKLTKTSNEIMSRHTGVCFAEVEFTTMQGAFRCHWSQHRSRKKPGGELQQPKHEIVDAAMDTILESRMRNVADKVEEVTGMDFDRFTRSTLLAQGGFAAFLKAKPDERAPLLEQITGSKIYSQISIKVHEILGKEKRTCDELEQSLAHIELIPEDREKELNQTLQSAEKRNEKLKKEISRLRKEQLWLKNIEVLQTEIQKHSKELIVLESEKELKKGALVKLQPALAARELEPQYVTLQNLAKSIQTNSQTLETIKKNLLKLTPACDEISQKKVQHQTDLNRTEEERKTGLELIKNVQKLDHLIQTEKKRFKEQKEIHSSDNSLAKKEQRRIDALKQELNRIEENQKGLTQFFQEHAGDEKLVTEYLLIEEKIKRLLELRIRYQEESRVEAPLAQGKNKEKEEVIRINAKLTDIAAETTEVQKELGFLQSKLQLLIRIQSLEEERKKLLTNQPCPLCGSTDHPYQGKKVVEISRDENLVHLIEIQEMLHKRANKWKTSKEEEKLLTKHQLSNQSDLKHKESHQRVLQEKIQKGKEILILLEKNLNNLENKRGKLFGNKDTAEESRKLEQRVIKQRQHFEKLQKQYLDTEKEITVAQTRQLQLQDEQQRLQQEINIQRQHFTKMLHDSPFADIDTFIAAKLPSEEITSIQSIANNLQKRKTELDSLLQDKRKRLKQEQNKNLTKKDLQSLLIDLQRLEQERRKQLEMAISARKDLEHNQAKKHKKHRALEKIASQKQILNRWSRLHMLIGSADGKKFRNFAQGLTFELMVHHANVHLAKMNNRYILVRDSTVPLDLNVIDTYQAGEVRSTKNLSGGESFLVSLALALGLSRMASNKIRVDSLFLDEGFGTLDEDALESALDTLSGLQEDGKLIGVISHVATLKERILLQIEIITDSGGISKMKGPGISRKD